MLNQEQIQERLSYVTGSDAAVICGLSPFKTKLQLWMEKTGRCVQDDISGLNHIKFGNFFEQGVADWFAADTGKEIYKEPAMLVHKEHAWMAGNIDFRIKGENAILECKTAFRDDGWGDGENIIPAYYLMQVAHYCAVGGFDRAYIAVVFASKREMRWYQYERNRELEEKLIARELDFWTNFVKADVCPDPVNEKDILTLYKDTDSKPVIVDDELTALLGAYSLLSNTIAANEKEKQKLKDIIALRVKDSDTLVDNSGKIIATYKYTKPTGKFDLDAFKKAHPDAYQTFYVEGSDGADGKKDTRQRRFVVKGDKDE